MKLLVTGGCGFLGSHVCEHFINQGWEVIAFDNMTKHELKRTGFDVEEARYHNYDFLTGIGVKVIIGDVRDFSELMAMSEGCDYLIHTAAQPAMTIALERPHIDFQVNVKGTLNCLEVARLRQIRMANCSTIHVYGNGINEDLIEGDRRFHREPPAIPENAPLLTGHITPLHASKRAAEIYVQAYVDTYGIIAANFRLTGMYAPRQFGGEDHGWVANFAIRTVLGLPIMVYGTDKQVRDILYATDAAQAFEAFWFHPQSGTYNIGGGEMTATSIGECLDMLADLVGRVPTIRKEKARRGDLYYFVCDISKAKSTLMWQPKIKPKEGIAELVKWIEGNKRLFAPKGVAV